MTKFELALLILPLVSCTTMVETKYVKQEIPEELLYCPSQTICTAETQTEVGRCLLVRNTEYLNCAGKNESIRKLVKDVKNK